MTDIFSKNEYPGRRRLVQVSTDNLFDRVLTCSQLGMGRANSILICFILLLILFYL